MMDSPVLFMTGLGRYLDRAENLKVLYDAYKGEKVFRSMYEPGAVNEAMSGKYDLMVIDIFPTFTTGKTIMIWHAIQGGKLIGLGQKGTYYKPEMAQNINWIVAAGRGGKEMFHQCTGVDRDRILPLGMPRTDRYIGKRKGDGGTVLAEKKAYLYVPTFRGKMDPPFPEIDWDYIDRQLRDDEVLAVKPHPYGQKFNLDCCRHIIELSNMELSVNYLIDCDVVITDYSSIMFDGYLLGKPAVLFEKKPGYLQTRGMYMQYPDKYCSRYATDESDLLWQVRSADGLTKTERDCMEYVAGCCDGHSIERIIKLIKEVQECRGSFVI